MTLAEYLAEIGAPEPVDPSARDTQAPPGAAGVRDAVLNSVTTQGSPAEWLAQKVAPGFKSTNTAGIYAKEPDVGAMAMGMAGPLRVVGPEFNPQLFHGGPKPIERIDPAKLQQRDSGFKGPGFYGVDKREIGAEYAHDGGVVTEFDLAPGSKVLDTTNSDRFADPADLKAVADWLRSKAGDEFEVRGEIQPREGWAQRLDNRWLGGDWPPLANQYARENGIDAIRVPYDSPWADARETVVVNPAAARFKPASLTDYLAGKR